jgi:nicotinamide-nucleotide amidase
MAVGAIERSKADLVVAITGVAGPEPDEDGNPVGLVFVAVASRSGKTRVIELRLGPSSKGEICRTAMRCGIKLLDEFLSAIPQANLRN